MIELSKTKSFKVGCSSVTGSGKFENSQAGNIELKYQECKASGISCTTSGQATGTILTTQLPFRVKSATEGKLALLVSPKEGHFATFSCSILVKVVISGNGAIGMVTSPGYGEESSTATLKFSGEKGVQTHTIVDGEETAYGLKASINGGASESGSMAGEVTLSFGGAIQPLAVKTLAIEISPPGAGTVKSTPIGIHCVIFCRSAFVQGVKVKLEVVEFALNFKEWKTKAGLSGTCVNATNPCQVSVPVNTELEAVFE
jgi:hypothetical protein